MQITYGPDADALYIELISDVEQVRTVQLSESIALDFGKGEVLAGIEILDAKEIIVKDEIPPVILKNLACQVA
jgi:uncharacterized protein YuzE